ncbi:PIR Superfamily Protein [Plasmodium ovale wallikeri]|uniref:PIR Superfamily Protein n=1 Tax=Plasmodium ovale wallikeri TaxID=864142 RepID=A0A1A9AND7_PLAOA|nr:PIR Superfamily Protein [Plasmodium ovale wallikeri]SBT57739.1 PIR Superfamily Protein [Plasmodium ovale wallikeri]
MSCKYGSSKENYTFLRNSPYYGNLIQGFETNELKQKREDVCTNFINDNSLRENSSVKEICKEFMYMYNYLNKIHSSQKKDKTITDEDCHFMNYWLNLKLKKNNIDTSMCVNDFYDKLRIKDESFFSSPTLLEKHLHVIDSGNLKNMELLYELYDTKQKIIDEMYNQDITENKKELCKTYTKKCYDIYIEGMDNCLNGYDDFYEALKDFKISYNYAIEWDPKDLKNCQFSQYFYLPNYDPVLEKQRNIMASKILSAPLILSFYTPLGTFLRTKLNIVKNRWMNSDEYERELSSLYTDIEDNISNNGEYNIGYYSETN